ncbi:MAG: hypothetical protein Q8K75_04915 [Chlamydiales bacterium]|nr:hypothetical protein [Chlamydiales bacterium]
MSRIMSDYTRTNPFLATLTNRYLLTKPDSLKKTYHLELDLRGSDFFYKPGDSIGVYPVNDPRFVLHILDRLNVTGDEIVMNKKGEALPFSEFLSSRANISRCSKKLYVLLNERSSSPRNIDEADLKSYLEAHELWDLLDEFHDSAITPQEICDLLSPLLPRFYSIASSHRVVGEQVDLTVALTHYVSNGHERTGVASHYLCNLAPELMPVIPVYMQPSKDFTVPSDPSASMIMIGPGTGVAPFRGFMQDRVDAEASGKNWLFFGERHRASEFYYEDYWHHLTSEGHLRLDVAFSRDQQQKLYVQHRLLANAAELYAWLEEGAYFYVCGDAEHMAKDVEQALLAIIAEQSSKGQEHAKAYLKALREQGRYLRDVY